MTERPNAITLKGNPMTLVGNELKVGDPAPDFKLTAADLSEKTLSDFSGKVKIMSVVPSIDTSVCDTQTRTFNEKASSLGEDVALLTISVDTPFAFKRWCGAAGVENIVCLSEFKTHDFAEAYGLRVKEVGFMARAVLVVGKDDRIAYFELVPEIAQEPDYDKALAAAQAAR